MTGIEEIHQWINHVPYCTVSDIIPERIYHSIQKSANILSEESYITMQKLKLRMNHHPLYPFVYVVIGTNHGISVFRDGKLLYTGGQKEIKSLMQQFKVDEETMYRRYQSEFKAQCEYIVLKHVEKMSYILNDDTQKIVFLNKPVNLKDLTTKKDEKNKMREYIWIVYYKKMCRIFSRCTYDIIEPLQVGIDPGVRNIVSASDIYRRIVYTADNYHLQNIRRDNDLLTVQYNANEKRKMKQVIHQEVMKMFYHYKDNIVHFHLGHINQKEYGTHKNIELIAQYLIQYIFEMIEQERLPHHEVVITDEYATSSYCPSCETISVKSRKNKSNQFECIYCGFYYWNADILAASNIINPQRIYRADIHRNCT